MIKLNIACGANMFPGWVNTDRVDMNKAYLDHLRDAAAFDGWPEAQRKLGLAVKEGLVEFVQHDLRQGFAYPDGSVDAIYCGQMIEHLNRRTEVVPFLRECYRMLKSGGRIRLTTPDIVLLLREHECGNLDAFVPEQPAFFADAALPEDQLAYLMFGASGENCTRENYEGHFHLYSARSLSNPLAEAGFCPPTASSEIFYDVIDCGMSHSFAIEGIK